MRYQMLAVVTLAATVFQTRADTQKDNLCDQLVDNTVLVIKLEEETKEILSFIKAKPIGWGYSSRCVENRCVFLFRKNQEISDALVTYAKIIKDRLEVISNNIANVSTTRDVDGKPYPYRRRIQRINDDGTVSVLLDEASDFRAVIEPDHPDADSRGFVIYPNVDLSKEFKDALEASRRFEMVVGLLEKFDKEIREDSTERIWPEYLQLKTVALADVFNSMQEMHERRKAYWNKLRRWRDPIVVEKAEPPGPADSLPMTFDQPVKIDVRTPVINIRQYSRSLLALQAIEFHFGEDLQLTADIFGSVWQGASGNFTIHATVFDHEGKQIGTAAKECDVWTFWSSSPMSGHRFIELDFGKSGGFLNARYFVISISERNSKATSPVGR